MMTKPLALASIFLSVTLAIGTSQLALADDLFKPGLTQSLAGDRRPSKVGDVLTIIIVAAADSRTTMTDGSKKTANLSGQFAAGRINEDAGLSLGGGYNGSGGVSRSERFVTQITASIGELLPNGDLLIEGSERLDINGEKTMVRVRGRIRPDDIDGQNQVQSFRMANAQIDYNGKGFVSKSAKPGLIHQVFGFLGLM